MRPFAEAALLMCVRSELVYAYGAQRWLIRLSHLDVGMKLTAPDSAAGAHLPPNPSPAACVPCNNVDVRVQD